MGRDSLQLGRRKPGTDNWKKNVLLSKRGERGFHGHACESGTGTTT